jgi:tetrahydromethanopterin S-methyltransferase subunit H
MLRYKREQKVCTIGNIRFGGQPGEYAPLVIGSMFQKGDKLLESRKERRFNEDLAAERVHEMERLSEATGVPGMVAMVSNTEDEGHVYIDWLTSVTNIPFAIDVWVPKTRIGIARYVSKKGLQERFLYNSITPWDASYPDGDVASQVSELKELGIKHVIVQAFDVEDQGPKGRIKSLEKMLPLVEKGEFESVVVDTAVMGLPYTAFSLAANRLIKEQFGLPVGCAPSNGTYMWRKSAGDLGRSMFPAVDAAVEAATAMGSDFIFYGPMSGNSRVFYSVAMASAVLSTWTYADGAPLPSGNHPLNLLFPEVVEQLTKQEKKEG